VDVRINKTSLRAWLDDDPLFPPTGGMVVE